MRHRAKKIPWAGGGDRLGLFLEEQVGQCGHSGMRISRKFMKLISGRKDMLKIWGFYSK